jgi:hypothetical protein
MGWSVKQVCDYFKRKLAEDQYTTVLNGVKAIFSDIDFEDDSGKRHKEHD